MQSQSGEIERLKTQLTRQQNPTIKVDLLNKMSFASKSIDRDSMRQFISRAKLLAKEINYDAGTARAMNLEAMLLITRNNYHKSIHINKQALKIARISKNDMVIAQVYTSLGHAYFNLMDYEKSLDACLKSEFFTRKTEDNQLLSTTLINIINIYIEQQDFNLAEQYIVKLAELSQVMDNEQLANQVDFKYGDLYYKQEDYKTALKHYMSANNAISSTSYSNKKAKQEIIRLLVAQSKGKESQQFLAKVQLN